MKKWINRMMGRIRNHIVIASTVLALSLMALGAVTDLVVDENGICSRAVNFINQIKISHALYLNQSAVYNYADNAVIELVGTVAGTGNLINGSDAKTTPVDADNVAITNSADSHKLGKTTWANIKATLKTYFDGLYQAVMTKATSSDVTTGTDDAKYVTSKALKDANIRANVQQIYGYIQDATITEAMKGALITNAVYDNEAGWTPATQNVTYTFAPNLSQGFWVDVVNEAGGGGIDGNVGLMLHANGDNDSTTITDYSVAPRTITNANILLKTATKKFGTASLYFNGTSAHATVPNETAYNLGTTYTIDMWVYPTDLSVTRTLISKLGPDPNYLGWYAQINTNGTVKITPHDNTGDITTTGTVSINEWSHVAFVCTAGTLNIYINGVSSGTGAGTLQEHNVVLDIGSYQDGAGAFFAGYIDELRVSKGVSWWLADFNTDLPNSEYYQGSTITITPASGEQLPGTAAADNTLISSTKGDVKNFFNTGNSWISKYTTGTWTDGL